MRVVLLAHVFPRAADDPLGAFLLHLIQAEEANADVLVVAPHAAGLKERELLAGVPVTRFRYAADNRETLAYTGIMHEQVARGIGGKLLFGRFLFAYFRAALRAVRAHKPAVIHAHWWLPGGLVGALASWWTKTPLVVTTHGTDVEQLRRAPRTSPLARFTFRRARVITCGSNYQRDQLTALGVADPARIRVIPMPVSSVFVNQEKLTTEQASRPQVMVRSAVAGDQLSVTGNQSPVANQQSQIINHKSPISNRDALYRTNLQSPFHILTVARLTRQKSVDTLLDALPILRARGVDARLKIIGDGDQRAILEAKTRAEGLEAFVEFLGMRPQAELPGYYADCDVFVLTSVREGMGLVLAEALLNGAPVIATNSGGVPDIVRDGETGLLFPERDAEELAATLERYARDPEFAARLAAEGRRRVRERFMPDRVAEEFLRAYEFAANA